MLRRTLSAVVTACLLALPFSGIAQEAQTDSQDPDTVDIQDVGDISDHYIVTLKKDVSNDGLTNRHKLQRTRIFRSALNGFSAHLNKEQLKKLKEDPDVLAIEADGYATINGNRKDNQVVTTAVQTVPTGVKRIGGTLSPTAKINGKDERVNVDIAIIDTGIDLTHPDLNVYKNVNFINPAKNANDDNGHGTHVAGIAAALDNTQGVVGVAPGARLWALKVLDRNGSGLFSTIIKGIDYVTAHANEIEVANMSLGCDYCTSVALDTAIHNSVAAGVVYAVAAGNSAIDAQVSIPANNPDVITVSAIADGDGVAGGLKNPTCYTDKDDTFADFSNFGAVVDIAAPGVCIYSTWMGKSYATISGTSMASPHVAGAAALYIATHTKPTNATGALAVKTALEAAGTAQTAAGGFTGDPDSFKEKLLNVSTF